MMRNKTKSLFNFLSHPYSSVLLFLQCSFKVSVLSRKREKVLKNSSFLLKIKEVLCEQTIVKT